MRDQIDHDQAADQIIDHFVAETKKLNGQVVKERAAWNSTVTPESIAHFAYGIGDDNPLWLDKQYAKSSTYGSRLAPPAYLTSVLYPILHGAPVEVPLTNLIGEIDYTWHCPIYEGDRLTARSIQSSVYDFRDKEDKRRISIVSDVRYWNQQGTLSGVAKGTMIRAYRADNELLTDRTPRRYSPEELSEIETLIRDERDRLSRKLRSSKGLETGMNVGTYVRGPLTIGDMVAWQAGAGPSYRGGILGYLDVTAAPHTRVFNPAIGWPVKYSHQHEDALMAADRGMPAPFDNGVMRFAHVASVLTNAFGDNCLLHRLRTQILGPNLYGDTTYYSIHIGEIDRSGDPHLVRVRVVGKNQLGTITTMGSADLLVPTTETKTVYYQVRAPARRGAEQGRKVQNAYQLFERHVGVHPDKTALVDEHTELSFLQLDRLVNRMAHWLLENNIEPGCFVGIHLDRGHANVAAILAVLKAGCAYVPFDPDYSVDRLQAMLTVTPLAAIIAHERHEPLFSLPDLQVLTVESFVCNSDDYDMTAPDLSVNASDSAYVMFTSGSVGHPKSVMVPHASLLSYIDALQNTLFPRDGRQVFLHTATMAFSASTRQTFLPLCTGNTLVVASDVQRKDPMKLFALMRERGVTVWDSVPSILHYYLRSLLAIPGEARSRLLPDALRYVCSTGQAMDWTIPRMWYEELAQQATIVNLYSQTETAGTVCAYAVPRNEAIVQGPVPIGRPLVDTQVILVDEKGYRAEPGTRGEIVVAGNRISTCYLNDPELTRQRYVTIPQILDPDTLVFRTGDLGVQRADGVIEHHGRLDDRIKIRGMGVELRDIERVLSAMAGIEQGTIIARGDEKSDYKLYGFVVLEAGSLLDSARIKNFLRGQLPPHMIPAAIEIIEAMPLSPNGKIDKSKLNPTLEREGQKAQIAGSQNLAENLCRLWEDILDVPEIQLDDDFYDLGGHSLLAVEMADRIEHEFNSRIEITDLIGVSTVRQLADLLRKRTAAEADALSPVAVLKKGGAKPPLFCIPGIGGHLMRHMVLPAYLENDQPLYGIQATGYENDLDRFAQIEAIAFRYLSEIKSIQPEGPYYLVGTCFGGVVAYEMAAQLTRSGDTVALLVLVETRAPDRLIPSSMILLERLERFYGHMRSRFISAEANRPARQRKAKLVHAAELKDMRPGSNAQPNLELKKTLRAARKAYKPGRFSGKVILFKVRDSPYRRQVLDRRRPWKRVAGGGFKEVWIPGNHLSMLEEPLVRSLGEELSKYLRIAREHHAVFAKGGTYQATEARN